MRWQRRRSALIAAGVIMMAALLCTWGCDGLSDTDGTDGTVDGGTDGSSTVEIAASVVGSIGVADGAGAGYLIAATSSATGKTYKTLTDSDGSFSIGLPEDEVGSSVIVSILGSEGKPYGSLVNPPLSRSSGRQTAGSLFTASSGIVVSGDFSLGEIDLPESPGSEPLLPGEGSDIGEGDFDPDIFVYTGESGVPIGVPGFGKGDDSISGMGLAEGSPDADGDGLVDVFDADDDGDGVTDDFDADADADAADVAGFRMAVGMLLDVSGEEFQDYIGLDLDDPTDQETIRTALVRDLRLDILVEPEDENDLSVIEDVIAVRALGNPGPAYLADLLTGPAQSAYPWAGENYALPPYGGGDYSWAVSLFLPDDSTVFFEVGDTFTLAAEFEDAGPLYLTRMLNYVFRYPSVYLSAGDPDLTAGVPGAVSDYDPDYGYMRLAQGGTGFEVTLAPPLDETGRPITTGGTFELSLAYDGLLGQVYDLDESATFGDQSGMDQAWQGVRYTVNMEDLAFDESSPEGNMPFTVSIPVAMLPESVTLTGGTQTTVTSYGLGTRFTIRESIMQNSIALAPAKLVTPVFVLDSDPETEIASTGTYPAGTAIKIVGPIDAYIMYTTDGSEPGRTDPTGNNPDTAAPTGTTQFLQPGSSLTLDTTGTITVKATAFKYERTTPFDADYWQDSDMLTGVFTLE